MVGALCDDGLHGRVEVGIEMLNQVAPYFVALGDVVEFLLHICREVVVHDFGEVVDKEVVDDDSHVGGDEASAVASHVFLALVVFDLSVAECNDSVSTFCPFELSTADILALLNGRDGRGISGGSSDAQFLEFMYECGLVVSHRRLAEAFGGSHLFAADVLSFGHRGKQTSFVVLFPFLCGFAVNTEESVETDHFARCIEFVFRAVDGNGHRGLFQFGVSHLAGYGAFPDEVV